MTGLPFPFAPNERQMFGPVPRLGEHTEEALATWLQLDRDEIAKLQRAGVLVSEAAVAGGAETILTAEVRAWIGRTSALTQLPEEISASDVRRYIEATGDNNPLWSDDEAARAAGYRGCIVPPMLLTELIWRLKNTELGLHRSRAAAGSLFRYA